MFSDILFVLCFAVFVVIGFMYFRDLGDVSQLVLKIKRANMERFIRNEYRLLAAGLGAGLIAAVMHVGFGGGPSWLFWLMLVLTVVFYAVPWIYLHLGLRNQKASARYYSIDEAQEFVSPTSQVLVLENNGVARAYPQAQIMRPHLAGSEEGLDGTNVIMTYCALANLGLGYIPEVEGAPLDLEVLAQHGNNLIMRDNRTGEPIQQIFGYRGRDGSTDADGRACPLRPALAMTPWPTFRMTFRGFQKAFPDGRVFLNKPPSNPLLFLLDMAMELAFAVSIDKQHREAAPVMQNLSRPIDPRLPTKTYVWGVNINGDATCWTDDFVIDQGNVVNAEVGGQSLVVAWDPKFESLNVWINDTGVPVSQADFFGQTPNGPLQRSPDVKPGMFWHVWAEFFPHTDINRIGSASEGGEQASDAAE